MAAVWLWAVLCVHCVEELPGQGCATVPAVPVSWFPGEASASDIMGPNTGRLRGGATYANGMVGLGFRFDGIDDEIRIPDDDSLKFTTSFTIEAWLQVNSSPPPLQGHGQIFFRGDNRGGADPYYLSTIVGNKLRFHVESEVWGANLDTPIPLNQFLHVVATLDDATGLMTIYIDGAIAAQRTTSVRPFAELDPNQDPHVGIGNHGGAVNQPFHGRIDELSVYDVALTQPQVQALFAAGAAGKCRPTVAIALPFGTGCTAGAGIASLDATAFPQLGETYTIQVSQALPNTSGTLYFGMSKDTWGSLPLPWTVPFTNGCALYVSPDLSVNFATDATGTFTWGFPIANDPSFLDVQLYSQALLIAEPSPLAVGMPHALGATVGI